MNQNQCVMNVDGVSEMGLLELALMGIGVGLLMFWAGVYFEYKLHNPKIKP